MPRDPWPSSYGNGSPEQAAAPYPYSSFPTPRRPDIGPRGGRGALVIVLILALVVALGAGALVMVLLLGGSAPAPGVASPQRTAVDSAPRVVPGPGELPVPSRPTGTATLADPTITVPKAPLLAAVQWCSLLTAEDIRAVTGFEQRGLPDDSLLCTHYLEDDAGHLFVSDIPASEGAAYAVRGNSAIVYQGNPTACEVTVALNRGGGVLDIDLRGVASPRVPLCDAAASLAARAFDRLPAR